MMGIGRSRSFGRDGRTCLATRTTACTAADDRVILDTAEPPPVHPGG